MKIKFLLLGILIISISSSAQKRIETTDSTQIDHKNDSNEKVKVLHAEPLYIDLIRDLGARKGEKEWNLGFGMTDNLQFDSYEALIEYEWAPIDRLGLEVELPCTFYAPMLGTPKDAVPSGSLNSLKLAAQWSFFVHQRMATSMALGYINELKLSDFKNFGSPLISGNVYNPFLVVAKRWGSNLHSLIYTGPKVTQYFNSKGVQVAYDVNSSVHYMISGTRNFIGAEFNKTFNNGDFDMTIRPQMRLGIADNLLIGIIAGIPVSRENERLSAFARLIWEPGHHKK